MTATEAGDNITKDNLEFAVSVADNSLKQYLAGENFNTAKIAGDIEFAYSESELFIQNNKGSENVSFWASQQIILDKILKSYELALFANVKRHNIDDIDVLRSRLGDRNIETLAKIRGKSKEEVIEQLEEQLNKILGNTTSRR